MTVGSENKIRMERKEILYLIDPIFCIAGFIVIDYEE